MVGEAPGAEEDLQGIPFVGKSGKLLTAMLDSLGLVRRRDCVILNVLKCRPPRNRNPQPEEIVCCGHWLARQLELLKPDVLFLAGRFAISSLLKPADEMFSISKMRGRIHLAQLPDGRQVPAVATYHPSYLLRSPAAKSKAWEDLLLLKAGDEAGRADAACSGKALGLSLLRLRFQVLFCSPLRLQRPICCFLIQTVECG